MGEEWQDKYRYAKAYEQVVSDYIDYIVGLSEQAKDLNAREQESERSIEEA